MRQKQATILLLLTLSNFDLLTKFFHYWTRRYFYNKLVLKFLLYLIHVAAVYTFRNLGAQQKLPCSKTEWNKLPVKTVVEKCSPQMVLSLGYLIHWGRDIQSGDTQIRQIGRLFAEKYVGAKCFRIGLHSLTVSVCRLVTRSGLHQ